MTIASDTIGLLFKARGDTDEARNAFKKLRDDMDGHAKDIKSGVTNAYLQLGQSIGLTESQVTKLGAALPVVGGVIAGVAAAGAGLAATMFKLASDSAEFGSKIHDVAEKTGLSTEAISSLKVAADQSGTSIETVASGVQKFTLLLADAAKGSDKAKAKLADLRVTSNDLETAFAQAVKRIYELPPGLEQNAAAADAFGRRMGSQLIPLINQFKGDLPGLIAECEKLGLTWSKKDADAADALGDQTTLLGKQLQGLKNTIGKELVPFFIKWTGELSAWIAKNKNEVSEWAKAIGDGFDEVVRRFQQDRKDLQTIADFFHVLLNNDEASYQRLQQGQTAPATYNQKTYDYSRPQDKKTGGYTDEEAKRQQADEEEKAKKDQERLYQERLTSLSSYYRNLIESTRESYDNQQKLLEEAYKKGEITEEQYRESSRRTVSAYFDFVSDKINKQEQIEIAQAKNDVDRENAHLEKVKATNALKHTLQADTLNIDKNVADQQKKLHEDEAKREHEEIETINKLIQSWSDYGEIVQSVLDTVDSTLEKWARLNEEARKRTEDVLKAERDLANFRADQQRKVLVNIAENSYGKAQIAALERLRDFDIAEAQRREQDQIAELNREEAAALESVKGKENEEEQKFEIEELYRQKRLLSEAEFQQKLDEIRRQFAINTGQTATGGIFDQWSASWIKFFGLITSQAPTLQSILGNLAGILQRAFQGVANAIGNVVSNWVLYGKTGPAIMRQILAQALASVAAEAAVRAIFELAAGFASLFFNPAEAAAHFTAAALYGSIAVVSGLAGRAIAGNSFNKQNQGAYGNAGTAAGASRGDASDQGQYYSSNPDATIDEGRNQPGFGGRGGLGTLVIRVESNDSHIIKIVRKNMSLNGVLRTEVAG